MALKFGTSGVRGLVTDMTDRACGLYATAYARHLADADAPRTVALAGDLRSSTPRIKRAVTHALRVADFKVIDCGYVPTPALAAYAMQRGYGCVMVTGSHIPDDRNGIKFYLPRGEALKADEQAISGHFATLSAEPASDAYDADGMLADAPTTGRVELTACREYEQRFVRGFPVDCLRGRHVVLYEHSAVGRDLFARVLRRLGARVTTVGRSDGFVPVDTEAVAEPARLAAWVAEYGADALLSLDGDSDRPLVVDDAGEVLRGDVLGILVSQMLGADHIATPVSCNTALEKLGQFQHIVRTRIGSPYVIEGMAQAGDSARMVVGYEANGGFLTGSDCRLPGARAAITALPTRDALLPIIALLAMAAREGCALSALRDRLPPRYTCSGLLRDFPSELGAALVAQIQDDPAGFAAAHLEATFGLFSGSDFTDGARLNFGDDILHFRPSGNAPEFRCYTESDTPEAAQTLNDQAIAIIAGFAP